LGHNILLGEELDSHKVDLTLESGDLALQLCEALLQRAVQATKPFRADLAVEVQSMGLFHLCSDGLDLLPKGLRQAPLFPQGAISPLEIGPDIVRGEKEALELIAKDLLKVGHDDLGPTFRAGILVRFVLDD